VVVILPTRVATAAEAVVVDRTLMCLVLLEQRMKVLQVAQALRLVLVVAVVQVKSVSMHQALLAVLVVLV
jgi:hypothetical protein